MSKAVKYLEDSSFWYTNADNKVCLKKNAEKALEIQKAEVIECLKNGMPSNWLDPILTGPDYNLNIPADCSDIIGLMDALRKRLIKKIENL